PVTTPGTTVLTQETGDAGIPGAGEPAAPAAACEGEPAPVATGEGDDATALTYADFKLPEGLTLDASYLEKITEAFKTQGLTQEQVQGIVDAQAAQVQAAQVAQAEAFNQRIQSWQTEAKADAEL